MSSDLDYIIGVSWPRSGHHLLVNILKSYYGKTFRYCNYYNSVDCCRTIPCSRFRYINFSKNHDYRDIVPITDNRKYIIQYRKYMPSIASDFELYLRRSNRNNDTAVDFRRFATESAKNYLRFMERWSSAAATNTTFVRLSYERLIGSPEETLRTLVTLFSPSRPCDERKLASSIQAVAQTTVKDRVEVVDSASGVHGGRDFRSFRFYDEALFQSLDQLTKPAYEKMAALPWVTRIDGETIDPGAPLAPAPDRRETSRQLFVDTTGMLEIADDVQTDPSRFQTFVMRRAVEDPDIEVVCYDRQIQAFRNLVHSEKLLLAMGPLSGLTAKQLINTGKPALTFTALRLAIKNPLIAKVIDRQSAATAASTNFTNAGYVYVKNTLRVFRYYRRALEMNKALAATKFAAIDDLKNGILLMPDIMAAGQPDFDAMAAPKRRVYICNDLIPLPNTEPTSDPSHEQQTVSRLTIRLESGALVLYPSDTSRAILQEWIDRSGSPGVRIEQIGRFRPPSLLFEKAQSYSRVSRFKPNEPFILCPSTIEPRKNHHLLARVWKQAHDQCVALPKLICVGKLGHGVDELRNFLNAHPYLRERIEFRGPVNDFELIDLYRSALFAVVPSLADDWGDGVCECLDFWMPVIVSTAPALREAVQGLMPIIEPNDVDGWLAQIRRLSENTNDLAALQDAIVSHYQPIESQESWNTIKKAIADYY